MLASLLPIKYSVGNMPVTAVLGEQRGDEGKGRYVDMLMPEFEIGARFNGGCNAGHTIVDEVGTEYNVHGLPSSILHEHATSVMGNGVVIDPVRLCKEIDTLQDQGIDINPGRLLISGAAHLILPQHKFADEFREAGIGQLGKQGSTKSGIAQAYSDKAMRTGFQAGAFNHGLDDLKQSIIIGVNSQSHTRDLWGLPPVRAFKIANEYVAAARRLGPFVTDTALYLNRALRNPTPYNVLAEGAQAFLLDLDHGMYPMVTSSSATIGGVMTGLGIGPGFIENKLGVYKAVPSHVGDGHFITEIHDEALLDRLHGDKKAVDAEVGTTTGRTRRLGHLDLAQIRRAQMINQTDEAAITKLDWVPRYGEQVLICVGHERKGKLIEVSPDVQYKLQECEPVYESLPTWDEDISGVRTFTDLPSNAQSYIEFIESNTGVPIKYIGVGPGRDEVITRD